MGNCYVVDAVRGCKAHGCVMAPHYRDTLQCAVDCDVMFSIMSKMVQSCAHEDADRRERLLVCNPSHIRTVDTN